MIFFHPASLSISFAFILEKHHLAIILSLLRKYLSLPFLHLAIFPESRTRSKLKILPEPSAISSPLLWGSVQCWLKRSCRVNKTQTFIFPPSSILLFNFHNITALLFFTFQLSSYLCLVLCLTVVCYQLRLPLCFHLHRSFYKGWAHLIPDYVHLAIVAGQKNQVNFVGRQNTLYRQGSRHRTPTACYSDMKIEDRIPPGTWKPILNLQTNPDWTLLTLKLKLWRRRSTRTTAGT